MSATPIIFEGLSGWHRYGLWTAHFFVNGRQQCNTAHGLFLRGRDPVPKRPEPAELTRHNEPFGKVCGRCLKVARGRIEPLSVEAP